MRLKDFCHPLATHYQSGDLGFEVIYSPEVVKTFLTETQLNQILNGFSTQDKDKLPTNPLADVSSHIISSTTEFLNYELYHGETIYNNHELVFDTDYKPDDMHVTLNINVKKDGLILEYGWV